MAVVKLFPGVQVEPPKDEPPKVHVGELDEVAAWRKHRERQHLGDLLEQIEASGKLAFQAGLPISACPKPQRSAAWKAWRNGWRIAAKAAGFKLKGEGSE
jgi:hypothetical protein